MKFSERGIPILPVQEKIEALRECVCEGATEDAIGHLWDLMAHVRIENAWDATTVMKLFETYGKEPTPIDA